jgi:hypothetical protein
MDGQCFDRWARLWRSAQTRRGALMMLGGSSLAALLARLDVGEVAACHKAKKHCKHNGQCCSGRCKHGRCKGNVKPADNFCAGNETAVCGDGCVCVRSAGGADVCGEFGDVGCSEDAQCVLITGRGSVCFFNKDGLGQCAAPCPKPF